MAMPFPTIFLISAHFFGDELLCIQFRRTDFFCHDALSPSLEFKILNPYRNLDYLEPPAGCQDKSPFVER